MLVETSSVIMHLATFGTFQTFCRFQSGVVLSTKKAELAPGERYVGLTVFSIFCPRLNTKGTHGCLYF